MICIHHNKDMDGYVSGAIVKKRYPDATLIGWDYKDEIPDFAQFNSQDVIMIDITFPLETLRQLRRRTRSLTVIDHHISFKKQFDEVLGEVSFGEHGINYIYEADKAACEIGWKYFFTDDVPEAIELIGRYDTWRQKEGFWTERTLPFKYYMYSICNSAEDVPEWVLEAITSGRKLYNALDEGFAIMRYQEKMDEAATRGYAFENLCYNGMKAICLNAPYFSSETVKSVFNPEIHDIMVGFNYTGDQWVVSLRSVGDKVDVSLIAKARGGGGHKNAAGFQAKTFQDIFI